MRRLARLLRRSGELAQRAIRELTEQAGQKAPNSTKNTSAPWGHGNSWLGARNPSLEPAYSRYRRPPFGLRFEAKDWRNPWSLGFDAPTGYAWSSGPSSGPAHAEVFGLFSSRAMRWGSRRDSQANNTRSDPIWEWDTSRSRANDRGDAWQGTSSGRYNRSYRGRSTDDKLGRDFFIAWHNVSWWNTAQTHRKGAFDQIRMMKKNKQHICPTTLFRWYRQSHKCRFHRMMYGPGMFCNKFHHFHHHHHHRHRQSRLIKGFRMLLAARLRRYSYLRRFWSPFTANLHWLVVSGSQQLPPPNLGVRVMSFNGARVLSSLADPTMNDERSQYSVASLENLCRAAAVENEATLTVHELMKSSLIAQARKALITIMEPFKFEFPSLCPRRRCQRRREMREAEAIAAVPEPPEPPTLPMQLESIGVTVALTSVVEFELGARLTLIEPDAVGGLELTEEVVSDLAAALQSHSAHVSAVTAEIARLSELGELPISIVADGQRIRVHFPNCDVDKVAVLLEERDVTHGRILEVPTVMVEAPPPPSEVSSELSPISSAGSSFTEALSSIHSSWQEFLADVPGLQLSESTFSSINGSSLATIA